MLLILIQYDILLGPMLRRWTMGVIVENCIAYHMLFCIDKDNHFLPLLKNKALFIYLFDYGTP